jgi:hypothetical protein
VELGVPVADKSATAIRDTVNCDIAPAFAPTCKIPALAFVAVGICQAYAVTEAAFGPRIEASPVVRVGAVVFGYKLSWAACVPSPGILTLDGVIAPKVSVIAGVVVAVATVPDTPFAVTIETVVTEPPPGHWLLFFVQIMSSTPES